jgi:hypothetical protein
LNWATRDKRKVKTNVNDAEPDGDQEDFRALSLGVTPRI